MTIKLSRDPMRTLILLSLLLLAGCISGPPKERESTLEQRQLENSTAAIATDVTRETQNAQPEVKLSQTNRDGSKTEIIVPAASESRTTVRAEASERGSFDASGSFVWLETIPLYVKIIGVAIGLGLLLAVGFLTIKFFRLSGAWKAGWSWFNDRAVNHINQIKSMQANEQDPRVVSLLKTLELDATNLHTEGMKDN